MSLGTHCIEVCLQALPWTCQCWLPAWVPPRTGDGAFLWLRAQRMKDPPKRKKKISGIGSSSVAREQDMSAQLFFSLKESKRNP